MTFVTSHGTKIYYEAHGNDSEDVPTMILAHGMGGNAAIWFHQIAHFIDRYRVIAFDHRYFGRSACHESEFRPDLFPRDVLNIMDAEEIERATFVCQSMGGWTGSQMAVYHSDRVERLVMSHTPGIFTNDNAVHDRAATSRIVSGAPGSQFGSAALAPDFPQKNLAGAVLYQQISAFNAIDPALIPRAIGKAGLEVDTATLQNYSVPTMFVSASQDGLFPAAYIEALAATLPGAVYTHLGDAGHSSYFESPAAFNAAVDDFIASTR